MGFKSSQTTIKLRICYPAPWEAWIRRGPNGREKGITYCCYMIDDQFVENQLKRRTGWMTAWPNEADARDCLGVGKSIRVNPEWDCLVTAGLTVQPKPEAENGSMAPEASSMQVRMANRYSNGQSGRQLVGPRVEAELVDLLQNSTAHPPRTWAGVR